MKKEYSKPEIMFENFTLSTNIAADCEVKNNNNPSLNVCSYDIKFGRETKSFFTDTITACSTTEADGEYNGFCYHTPEESYNLFNS